MKYLLAGLVGLILSMSSFAKDIPVTIDGKNIKVTDFDEMMFSTKLNSSDLTDGVYIVAGPVDNQFKNAKMKIEDVFKAHGIKIADSVENAGMAITFTTNLALDLAKADRDAANSVMPTHQQVASTSGQVIGAAMSGGVGGLIGFAAGSLFNTDSKLLIQATSSKKPGYHKGWLASGIVSSVKGGDNIHGAKIFYNLEKGKEASDDVVLKMAVDQWIKNFIVFDTTPAVTPAVAKVSSAASAVATTETLSEEK